MTDEKKTNKHAGIDTSTKDINNPVHHYDHYKHHRFHVTA